MNIISESNSKFESLDVSNIFVTDYLPSLSGNEARVYLYLCYLGQQGAECTKEALAAILNMDISEMDAAMVTLRGKELVSIDEQGVHLTDLKRKMVEKFYTRRTSVRPDEKFTGNADDDKNKVELMRAVNDRFFAGQMPSAWYSEIEMWLSKYGFSQEVVFMLFQICSGSNALTRPYARKVAESWGEKFGIKTPEELNAYLAKRDAFKTLCAQISKKIKSANKFTDYQLDIIEKWFYTFEYNFDVIDIALKEASLHYQSPSFVLYDKILSDWHDAGVKTASDALKFIENRKVEKNTQSVAQGSTKPTSKATTGSNFTPRKYDSDFFNKF